MKIKVKELASHRNGVGGEGFYVVHFRDMDENADMIGVVFREPMHTAVFDRELLGQGIVTFGVNSFRGDNYDQPLRDAIRDHEIKSWGESSFSA